MINGIDISHHNKIDWTEIGGLNLSQNLYFAFIKASEGTDNTDLQFAINRSGSASAGLLSGAYHFFLPTSDPIEQADLLASQVGSRSPGDLPLVADFECTKIVRNRKVVRPELWNKLNPMERIEVAHAFLNAVEQKLGVKPIIYTAASFWNEFIVDPNTAPGIAVFAQYPLWIVNLKGALIIPKPFSK